MKRYKKIEGIWSCDPNHILLNEDKGGELLDINKCVIAEQDDIMLGDDLDYLNKQIQDRARSDKHYEVMIIMKEKNIEG